MPGPAEPTTADRGMSYLLWLFGGIFGLHRYYLNSRTAAIWMTVLTVLVITIPITVVWWFVDLFLIDSLYREANRGATTNVYPTR